VHLGGDFNEWTYTNHQLAGPNAEGFYEIDVPLPAGQHEYKFIINEKVWKPDPGSRELAGFYGNSVVRIE
jgi:1,4-alpha-glucan branching enzyme